MKGVRWSVLSAAVLLLPALPVSAQSTEPGLESPVALPPSGPAPTYGSSSTVLDIGIAEFSPRNGASTWAYAGVGYVSRATGSDLIWAAIHVPNGAVIESVEALFNDTSAGGTGGLFVTRFFDINSFEDIGTASTTGAPGFVTVTVPVNRTVDNNTNHYVVYLNLPIDAAVTCKGARVRYHLQVSPAPAMASFTDVPSTNPFFRFVEALAASGITGGCGGGNFCPNDPVTRGQMAVFLSVALGLHWPN